MDQIIKRILFLLIGDKFKCRTIVFKFNTLMQLMGNVLCMYGGSVKEMIEGMEFEN